MRTSSLGRHQAPKWIIAAISMSICLGAWSAETEMHVLGYPLGGKLSAAPKICPLKSENSKTLCWVGAPATLKGGGKSGLVHLPSPDSRPEWAAHAMFKMLIRKDLTVDSLEVRTFSGLKGPTIDASISARFGAPTSPRIQSGDLVSSTWARQDVHIRMACRLSDFCLVMFRSPVSQAKLNEELRARSATNTARPISP